MPEEYRLEAKRIVEMVSWAYARRCWWADQRELEDQCWIYAHEVYEQGFDDGVRGFGTLAYVACMRQLGRALRRMQAPVSASDHEVVDMSQTTRANDLAKFQLPDRATRADDALIVEELRQKIRARLFKLLGATPDVVAAALVMLDGLTPQEVAEALGVEVWGVYRANELVVVVSKADKEIGRLARQLGEERCWL